MSGKASMHWKGRALTTIGDLAWGIAHCDTREEAQEFMTQYRAISPHADRNLGYMSGYYGAEEMRRIQEWFGVAHPIFGEVVPTTGEAFTAGERFARGELGPS